MQTRNAFSWLKKEITRSISVSLMRYINTRTSIASAYPTFALQGYENPREATGRIVCANCHLANNPVEIEVPEVENPRTATGEHSLDKLHTLLSDLESRGINSESLSQLKGKVTLRRGWDEHSTT